MPILNHRTDVAVSIRTDRQLRGESTSFGQASMQMDAVPLEHWLAMAGRLPSRPLGVPQTGLICWLIPVFPMVPGYPHRRHLAWRGARAMHSAQHPLPVPAVVAVAQQIEHNWQACNAGSWIWSAPPAVPHLPCISIAAIVI